jgi:hypothetical protein
LFTRGFVRQELEGYGLAEREIVGAIYLAHTTSSQQCNDAVTPGQ